MRAIQHTSWAFHSGALPCFYLRAAISSRRLHTGLWNPIKMTDYILSLQDLSFRKIYKSILIMWKKAEIWRTINPAWYVFYSNLWGAAGTCNSPALLLLHKRIRRLICITAYNLSCTVHNRLVFMHYFSSASLSDPSQQTESGSLALWLRKSLFHPRPLSLSTNNIAGADNQGIKAGQEKSCPQT